LTAKKSVSPRLLAKAATGILGFDEISRGGLPRNRTSLVMGGPGTGKTVFALQTLVNAAQERKQPGIFVAFEEGPDEIRANAATFGWGLPALAQSAVFFLDARLSPTVVQSGDFELSGMLAILEAKKRDLGAAWIVFDGIDVLLALLQNPSAEMREIYRLRDWLARNELTAIITAKVDGNNSRPTSYGFMQFMVDCVIRFDRRLEQEISLRRLEITKYRGSDFAPGEFPLSFGPHGGAPGTSKTTLAGKFAESACRRGEQTLFVSFDEGGERIQRNLTSVGIHLQAYVKSGLLRMYSGRTDVNNPEEHLIRITALIHEHRPRCMVIDPLSAIARTGALNSARAIGNRLIYKMRDHQVTALITSLVGGDDPQAEATELQISTIADTWIHLSYQVRSGERNRALSIVKSRGTQHSNQVRELVLSAAGPALAAAYSSGGEVLMGTLRWEKEAEDRTQKRRQQAEFAYKRRELQFAEADIAARITALQLDLNKQRTELALYTSDDEARDASSDEQENALRKRRGAGAADMLAPVLEKRRVARTSARPRTNGGKEPRRGS
jgi:circadian clock protein KaiC